MSSKTLFAFMDIFPKYKIYVKEFSHKPIFSWITRNNTSSLSWKELDNETGRFAALLLDRGLRKGDRAVLVFLPGLEFLVAFFGCLRVGLIAVPVHAPSLNMQSEEELLHSLIEDCQAEVIISTNKYLQHLSPKMQKWRGKVKFLSTEDAKNLEALTEGYFAVKFKKFSNMIRILNFKTLRFCNTQVDQRVLQRE